MKKLFRIASVLMAVLMMVSIMAACGETKTPTESAASQEASKTAPKEKITLKMWGGVPPESGPQKVVEDFNKEFADKGIALEYERFVNDDQGNLKLDTSLLAGSDIDIYATYSIDYLVKRANGNMALDLSEFIKKDSYDLETKFGPLAPSYYVNGKPYSIPAKIDQYGILINKKMFDEAGIAVPTSWTLDEFREIAKKLTKGEGQNKVYGMFFNSQQELTYPGDYFASQIVGGDWYYKSGTEGKESGFNDSVVIKSYKSMVDMMLVDKSAPTHVDSVTQKLTQEGMFLSGKAAMTIGSWIIRNVKDKTNYPHDFVTAFAPYPSPEKRSDLMTAGGLGDYMCINPKSKNTEAAWEFLKWYTEKGMMPMVEFGRVPSNVAFDRDSVVKGFMTGAEDLFDANSFKEVLVMPKTKYAVPRLNSKRAELKKVLVEEMEAAVTGKKTVEDALNTAKERGDKLLSK